MPKGRFIMQDADPDISRTGPWITYKPDVGEARYVLSRDEGVLYEDLPDDTELETFVNVLYWKLLLDWRENHDVRGQEDESDYDGGTWIDQDALIDSFRTGKWRFVRID